jgi:hypothetical protein
MKYLMIVLMAATLMGCAQFDAGFAVGTDKAKQAADRAYGAARYYVCKGASIGAVNRAHGKNPKPYIDYCSEQSKGVIGQ